MILACVLTAAIFGTAGYHLARRWVRRHESLDARLAPHVLSDLDLRIADYRITDVVEVAPTPSAWVGMSRDRWPRD